MDIKYAVNSVDRVTRELWYISPTFKFRVSCIVDGPTAKRVQEACLLASTQLFSGVILPP